MKITINDRCYKLDKLKEPEQIPAFNPIYYQSGWICPKCGSVYGPTASECIRCNPPMKRFANTKERGKKSK